MGSEGERLRRGLQNYFDAAGRVLREKPHRNTRFMARSARQRARLGLEALDRGDLAEAHKLYERALESYAMAAQMLAHGRLAPDARWGRQFRRKKTDAATRRRKQDAATREAQIIEQARRFLCNGMGRKKNGAPNVTALARACLRLTGPILGEKRVRDIISEAIENKKLEV